MELAASTAGGGGVVAVTGTAVDKEDARVACTSATDDDESMEIMRHDQNKCICSFNI
jgi:hypothetical protein